MKPTRKAYGGSVRSLVLALDIGTTFSGVSYAILEPGEVPNIHGVTRFPGQEHVAGNSKIPSIMYYDRHGKMKAAGAEADGASVLAQAEDEGWIKVELFKLRLRPKTMSLKMNGMRLSSLPRGKTAVEVFGDFLSYLFRCTTSFIIDTHANGQSLWRAVEHDMQLVLSHPNGWEGAQQTKMRRAAIHGGLIPDTDEGRARIRFVTEGEASLHACVLNGLAEDVLANPSGHGFIVADAGGGTLDISSYAIRGTSPLVIEEIAPPDCVFAGSVFVSRRARSFFEEKLKNSKYGTPDSLDHITKRFDETTKRLFRDAKEVQFVHFGSPLDKDLNAGIRMGQLKLTGAEVAGLFEPSIEAAMTSIKAQIEASGGQIKSVWLVGGFAASPWLFSQLQEHLSPFGVVVSRPDSQTSKAVADGAIGFYCDHHVSARMSKFMYGVEYLREYDENDEEHVLRKHRLFELPSGPTLLPDAFDCILARGLRVKESTVFSRKYCTEVTNLSTLSVFEVEIWCYRGGNVIPKWIIRNADNFSTLCYVRADLSPLAGSAQSKTGKNGKTYWTIVFSIEIHFGLTEFKARIKWTDNQRVKYGPASIVYNEGGHRAEEDEPDSLPEDESAFYSHPHTGGSRSYASSRAPSREGFTSSSRINTPAAQPLEFPKSPSRRESMDYGHGDRERRVSTGQRSRHDSDNWREREVRTSTVSDKGKERERSIPAEPPRATDRLTEKDRGVNISSRSTDSKSSARTAKLGEALSSVWDAPTSTAQSKIPTPLGTPAAEVTAFNVTTSREIKLPTPPVAVSKPPSDIRPSQPTSKAPTQAPVSHAPSKAPTEVSTPQPPSKAPTPAGLACGAFNVPTAVPSKAPTQAPSKAPTEALTPQVVSKAPSRAPSKAGSVWGAPSKAPTEAATPAVVSKAATPAVVSKAPTQVATPRAVSPPPPTKDETPEPQAPPPVSRQTSIWGTASKAGSGWGALKSASPTVASKATSKAASKATTPKATSKANTPAVEKSDPWETTDRWATGTHENVASPAPLETLAADPPISTSRPRSVFDDIYAEVDTVPPAVTTEINNHNDDWDYPANGDPVQDEPAPSAFGESGWNDNSASYDGGGYSWETPAPTSGDAPVDDWVLADGQGEPEEVAPEEPKKKTGKKNKKAKEEKEAPKVEESGSRNSVSGADAFTTGQAVEKSQEDQTGPVDGTSSISNFLGSTTNFLTSALASAEADKVPEKVEKPSSGGSLFGDVGGWSSSLTGGWGSTPSAGKRSSGFGTWGTGGKAASLFGFGINDTTNEPPVIPEPPSAKPGASPKFNDIPLDSLAQPANVEEFPPVEEPPKVDAPPQLDIPAPAPVEATASAETVPETPAADDSGGFETSTAKKKKKKLTGAQKKAEEGKKAEEAKAKEEQEEAERQKLADELLAQQEVDEEEARKEQENAEEAQRLKDAEAAEEAERTRKAEEEEALQKELEAAAQSKLEEEAKAKAEEELAQSKLEEEAKTKAEEAKAKADEEAKAKTEAAAKAATSGAGKKKKKKR